MTDNNKIKTAIILYTFTILALSVLTGKSIDQNISRWISGATSLVVIIMFAYDKWVWKWSFIGRINEYFGNPVIHGTWKGKIHYEKDSSGNSGDTEIYLAINQTLSSVAICSYVNSSSSYSITAALEKTTTGRKRLVYIYRSEAPYGKRDNNRPHEGTCFINVIGIPVRTLEGSYFTERTGAGTITLTEFSPKLAETFNEAKNMVYTPKVKTQ